MNMYDIIIDFTIKCSEEKIYPVKRPSFPAPAKRYKKYSVLGKDGEQYEDTGFYEDVVLPISFNYMTDMDNWHEFFRKCKKIFLNAEFLQLNDDSEYYYQVKKTDIDINQRDSKRIGRFNVEFTLDPYSYLVKGKEEYTVDDVLVNPYEISHPIYKIIGEGVCHLIINSTDCTCNVSNNLIIDTDKMLSYREDGTLQSDSINQDYDLLYLIEGDNTISISDGFELKIIPNWRCI